MDNFVREAGFQRAIKKLTDLYENDKNPALREEIIHAINWKKRVMRDMNEARMSPEMMQLRTAFMKAANKHLKKVK